MQIKNEKIRLMNMNASKKRTIQLEPTIEDQNKFPWGFD